jgi:hypothetical protein
MDRAFLYVEGALLQRTAEDSPTRVTEDFVRQALIDGLKASKPALANSVVMEEAVPWDQATNALQTAAALGSGRPRQHDVAIVGPLQLVCEVKWVKTQASNDILEDLWKLALTHGTAEREKECVRTFLLMGGIKRAFQQTLATLHQRKIPLRWSPQGLANQWPRPTKIKFGKIVRKQWGFDSLASVLKRRDNYYRQPPATWKELRCSAIARGYKTVRGAEWKIVLWELDFRTPCERTTLNWSGLRQRLINRGL